MERALYCVTCSNLVNLCEPYFHPKEKNENKDPCPPGVKKCIWKTTN